MIEPIHLDLHYSPLLPAEDTERRQPFHDEDYRPVFTDSFEDCVRELIDISVWLIRLLPDPSLSPDERLERLARVVPGSQMVTAHRKSVRHKLYPLKRRLDELVPHLADRPVEQLDWLRMRLEKLVPGDLSPIQRLERLGDYRGTDVGVSPRSWQ